MYSCKLPISKNAIHLLIDGLVYGSHPGEIPKINIRNLSLKSAGPTADLFEEARIRIHERSGIDCW